MLIQNVIFNFNFMSWAVYKCDFGFQGSMVVILPKLRRKISLAFLFTVILNIVLSIVGFVFLGSIGIALATMLSILLREIFISYFFKNFGFHPLFFKNIDYLK